MPSNLPIDGYSFRRVGVLTGAPRRRRWSAVEKAAIVAESFAPGAVTSTVALRHGLHRNQLYAWRHAWRRELRSGAIANAGVFMPDFVPVVTDSRAASRMAAIVAESLAPGAVASTIALRHGLHRNQLYMWRRELRSGALAKAGAALPDFVPIVSASRAAPGTAVIEIEIGAAVLRADAGVDLRFLGKVIRLLKAT